MTSARGARALAALAAATCLGGGLPACAKGPPPWRPPEPAAPRSLVPAAPPAGGGTVAGAGAGPRFTDATPSPSWWRALGDERLARLLAEVRRSSPDLAAAAARVRAARAAARRARAERVPNLDGLVDASVYRGGDRGPFAGSKDTFDTTLEPSWELDLFGRLGAARDAADADALALEEDRRALLLSLESEAALAWFDWGAAAEEEAVDRETATLLGRTRDLAAARLDAGLGDELAVRRVEAELATALAAVPEARLRGGEARRRLALLLGRPPDAEVDGPPAASPPLPAEIPLGLPAGLLRRRPDVRAAERRIEAAHARVREAWDAFWPTVVLSGRAGNSVYTLADLFDGRALFGLVAPSLRVPLLDAGRLEADRLAIEANRDEAAAQRVAVALHAFTEVADAVEGVGLRREALDRRHEAVASARRAADLANARFEARLVGYLDVIESMRSLAEARLGEVSGEHALRQSVVGLVKALGGGWDAAGAGAGAGTAGPSHAAPPPQAGALPTAPAVPAAPIPPPAPSAPAPPSGAPR